MTAQVIAVLDSWGSLALAVALTVPIAALMIALAMLFARKAVTVSRRRPRGGVDGMIGHVGVVRRPLDPIGHVAIDGELWRARRSWAEEDEPAPGQGDPVVVHDVQGLTLSVRRAEIWEVDP
jgi:membrane protein implicated in regulation of membrane protease activity